MKVTHEDRVYGCSALHTVVYNFLLPCLQPEPGSHYTAWSSVSTLIRKQLITKSATVPAKYTLTEAGSELAQRMIRVGKNSTNESSSDGVEHSILTSTLRVQKSKEDITDAPSVGTIKHNNLASQDVLEARLPKPWLLSQKDAQITNTSSISLKEDLIVEEEVVLSDKQNFKEAKSISDILPSKSMLPSNYMLHNSVQSDALRYKHVMVLWSNVFILFQWELLPVLVC